MDNTLSLHLKKFNDKVKLMNQSGGRQLSLTAQEARSLQSDIYDLLSLCASLSKQLQQSQSTNQVISVSLDGGGFK
jgi:conjugal transfer/entry exclusion protein